LSFGISSVHLLRQISTCRILPRNTTGGTVAAIRKGNLSVLRNTEYTYILPTRSQKSKYLIPKCI
jgi:hypothetical protein